MPELILLETTPPIATITLNRPQRHNSLVPEMLAELLDVLNVVEADDDVRAVVLQANGRSFSTGGDVKGFYLQRDNIKPYARQMVGLLNDVILTLVGLPVPVVTAVHGNVTGGSMGLVLASDVVLVVPEVGFTPYYSVVGFSPDGGWTAMLPEIIGRQRTAAILLQNDTITAEQAVAWGLAARLVSADEIQDAATAVAHTIAAMQPGSVRHTRHLLRGLQPNLAARLEAERTRFVRQIATAEALQGMREFLRVE